MKVVQVTPEQFTKIMWKFGFLLMLLIIIPKLAYSLIEHFLK